MFLGDHTSPDKEGYVGVVRDVLARFHPTLRPNLISTGSPEQTARALNSDALHNLLVSSHPNWLVIGIGLADALREPLLAPLAEQWKLARSAAEADEATFGRERTGNGSGPGARNVEAYRLARIDAFAADLGESVRQLAGAGVRPILLTTVLVGEDITHPLNSILKTYNRAIREAASRSDVPLVDVERAFNDLFLRAGQYKQRVALAGYRGEITPQGEALLARTLLHAFGLLPYPGHRPLR
jgi:hypothetical protein